MKHPLLWTGVVIGLVLVVVGGWRVLAVQSRGSQDPCFYLFHLSGRLEVEASQGLSSAWRRHGCSWTIPPQLASAGEAFGITTQSTRT